MKTEQEVREAITKGLEEPICDCVAIGCKVEVMRVGTKRILSQNEVQDLAVIIGKALGVVE